MIKRIECFPGDLLNQLQFDRAIESISEYCAGSEAKELINDLYPHSDFNQINKSLIEIDYLLNRMQLNHHLELSPYFIPKELAHRIDVENYVLPRPTYKALYHIILNVIQSQSFFKIHTEIEIPISLFNFSSDLIPLKKQFENVFDEEMNIRPSASPALLKIHRGISRLEQNIFTQFDLFTKKYRSEGLLSEFEQSYKNGRRVLAMPVENKRQIAGVLHGQSESGKTVYIEPQAVTLLNNDLLNLKMDRQKEEFKILQNLCDELRNWSSILRLASEQLIQLDVKWSQASYSRKYNLQVPQINKDHALKIVEAGHPLLFDRLKSQGEKLALNSIKLHEPNKILLVSGPNAGGKSILLKTLAFNQLLFQCGLPIMADPKSEMSIFEKICVEIGDNQSLDDDLSTYSSHLLFMKKFMEEVNEKSLVMIDEFGTGTDPRVGGALAESILHVFVKKGACGLITTHYSNLKAFAYKTKGVVNGNMSFNMEKLKPSYKLNIGKPGSSFAFEIAERIGLPTNVLKAAHKKVGNQTYELEKLLNELTSEKEEVELKAIMLKSQEKQLKILQNQYEILKRELDILRKKNKTNQKIEMSKLLAAHQDELKQVVKGLKSKEVKKLAEDALKKAKENQEREIDRAKKLRKEIHLKDGSFVNRADLKVGDFVQIRDAESKGKVLEIGKKKIRVALGNFEVLVPVEEIFLTKEPLQTNKVRSIQYERPEESSSAKIDIRGLSVQDGRETLIKYLDRVIVSNLSFVEIIHGKGSGVLRRLVSQIVKEYKDVKGVEANFDEDGGVGSTRVLF